MSASDESTPLLPQHNGGPHSTNKVIRFIKGEGEVGWRASYHFFLFGSWWNILLLFIPLSIISHQLNWDAGLRFIFSFLAIMPLAKLLGDATEQLSFPLGETLAGLLNASFGNAVEIIVGLAALLQNELRIVQTSLLGSILSNILLVLGCSFLAGGLVHPTQQLSFARDGAQSASSLMTLACITLVIPAAYRGSKITLDRLVLGGDPVEDYKPGLLVISRGTSILLVLMYIAFLVFHLKTHHYLFERAQKRQQTLDGEPQQPRLPEESPRMNAAAACVALVLVTVVTSFCADYLVASIEETAERYHISKSFIGLILLPIVANAAEHVTSVWMAMKDKTTLSIEICVGSSIQIASFVIPLLVIVGWITGHDLTLFFADFETIVLFVSVLLVNMLIQDGKGNYMEGLLLITLYLVIALAFWVS